MAPHTSYHTLPNTGIYSFEKRAPIKVKGKGLMQTYFVLGRSPRGQVSAAATGTAGTSAAAGIDVDAMMTEVDEFSPLKKGSNSGNNRHSSSNNSDEKAKAALVLAKAPPALVSALTRRQLAGVLDRGPPTKTKQGGNQQHAHKSAVYGSSSGSSSGSSGGGLLVPEPVVDEPVVRRRVSKSSVENFMENDRYRQISKSEFFKQ
jgi:hypothetical protein